MLDHVLDAQTPLNPLDIMKSAFILLGVALVALKAMASSQSPPVKVSLRSSWPASPLLDEILYVCLDKYAHVLNTVLEKLWH